MDISYWIRRWSFWCDSRIKIAALRDLWETCMSICSITIFCFKPNMNSGKNFNWSTRLHDVRPGYDLVLRLMFIYLSAFCSTKKSVLFLFTKYFFNTWRKTSNRLYLHFRHVLDWVIFLCLDGFLIVPYSQTDCAWTKLKLFFLEDSYQIKYAFILCVLWVTL